MVMAYLRPSRWQAEGVEDSTPLGLARGPVPLLLLASELIPILDPHRIDLQRPRRGRLAVGTNLS
jgi:hypothetical protein